MSDWFVLTLSNALPWICSCGIKNRRDRSQCFICRAHRSVYKLCKNESGKQHIHLATAPCGFGGEKTSFECYQVSSPAHKKELQRLIQSNHTQAFICLTCNKVYVKNKPYFCAAHELIHIFRKLDEDKMDQNLNEEKKIKVDEDQDKCILCRKKSLLNEFLACEACSLAEKSKLLPFSEEKEEKKRILTLETKYSLDKSLPELEEVIIERGSFWCQNCYRFNAEHKSIPLGPGRGIHRIFCNFCGEEDVLNARWICPCCSAKHVLSRAEPKFFHSHFCVQCKENFPSVQIVYTHLHLDEKSELKWLNECLKEVNYKNRLLLYTNFENEIKEKKVQLDATQNLIQQLKVFNACNKNQYIFEWNSQINPYYRNIDGGSILQYTMCTCISYDNCKHKRLAFWLVAHGLCPYYYLKPEYQRLTPRSPWPHLIWPFFSFYQQEYRFFVIWVWQMAKNQTRKKNYFYDPNVFSIVRLFLIRKETFNHPYFYEFVKWVEKVEKMAYISKLKV